MISKKVLWFFCLWNAVLLHGQVVFSNVRLTSSAGVLTVCYDVQPTNDRVVLKAIRLTVLRDGDDGQPPLRITPKPSHTQGAIGTNVFFGVGQCIVWRCKPGGYIFKETIGVDLEADYTLQEAPCEPETVLIPGGTFQMGSETGSSDEKPVHEVTVSSFRMGTYEITVKQFRCFIESSGYQTDAEKYGDSYAYVNGSWTSTKGVNWKCGAEGTIRSSSEDNHPVLHVSWNDAVAYCQWLSKKTGKTYRLPTEAEWEYAAGNGSRHTKYAWGDDAPNGKKGGNVADETGKKKHSSWTIFEGYTDNYVYTAPVGQYNANDFGLYDMTGNVWEWCRDWYGSYSNAAVKNPTGADNGTNRVLRGGSWSYYPPYCRVAFRLNLTPSYRYSYVGFRVSLVP